MMIIFYVYKMGIPPKEGLVGQILMLFYL